MTSWKKAFQLNQYELKQSLFNILISYVVALLFMGLFIKQMPAYLDDASTILYDFLFILLFACSPLVPKPKKFELQHVQEGFVASPMVLIQKRLPIPDDIIIKSRLVMHFFYTFPIQLIVLTALYVRSPLHDILSFGAFLAFAAIWLSVAICIGLFVPKWNIGASGFWYTNPGMMLMFFISIAVILSALYLTQVFSGKGVVYWTIHAANAYPILSLAISTLMAITVYHLWVNNMRKSMKKVNYA